MKFSLENEIKAYAKVNLQLEILNRREDIYHNIFSLMASVDLFDFLKLEKADIIHNPGPVDVKITNAGGKFANILDSIPVNDNLISKAARLYMGETGYSGEISFSLNKNIPAGAGLGGGSADAAAAIRLLNQHFECFENGDSISTEWNTKVGLLVGADVPYCLTGGIAICEGFGEIIERLNGELDYWVLIANNGIHIDTGKAYESLNRELSGVVNYSNNENKKIRIRESVTKGNIDFIKDILINDFEKHVFELYPDIGRLKEKIISYGADFSILTGSGSSVIGLFRNKETAIKAKSYLDDEVKRLILTRFVNVDQKKGNF